MEQLLHDSRSVVLDASGKGTVTFGPQHPRQQYVIERISVQCSSSTLESVAKIYRGSVGDATYISGSFSGSSGDTDSDLNESLWSGQYLSIQWTGGDVGATARATFWGKIQT